MERKTKYSWLKYSETFLDQDHIIDFEDGQVIDKSTYQETNLSRSTQQLQLNRKTTQLKQLPEQYRILLNKI